MVEEKHGVSSVHSVTYKLYKLNRIQNSFKAIKSMEIEDTVSKYEQIMLNAPFPTNSLHLSFQ